MPFNLTFRRLLRKYIPQLSEDDINRYESLIALRTHIYFEGYSTKRNKAIKEITKKAQAIIKPVEPNFNRASLLWKAIREYSLVQGNILQVPPTLKDLQEYVKKNFNYRITQVITLPFLWFNKGKYTFTHLPSLKTITASVPTILILLGLVFGELNILGKPNVSGIPDQTIKIDSSFTPIRLDEYVSDPNHADSEMTWRWSGNESLNVKIDSNRIVKIETYHNKWTGSEEIIFTATDPSNLFDSDTALFTINTSISSIKN